MTLEEKLRALFAEHLPSNTLRHDDVTMQAGALMSLLRDAAFLGAEVEREEIARRFERMLTASTGPDIAAEVRARGTR